MEGRSSADSSLTRTRQVRQLCPDDCRCSDQDIDLGLCRRVVGSSSSGSGSDLGTLSVGVHAMPPRAPDSAAEGQASMTADPPDPSQLSSQSQSEPRSQGRDFEKDPILVPRSARKGRSSTSTYQHSFDQLQRGLDTLESNDSDADSDADQALAAQRRAESMARWTARRSSMENRSFSTLDRRSPAAKTEALPEEQKVSPLRTAVRSLAPDTSLAKRTTEVKLVHENKSATPLKATPGRKSIAAVFESMQKEREARAAEEHRQWQEKQARRERERAARAFGLPGRRRTSAGSNSVLDSPASVSTAPDTPSLSESIRKARSAVVDSPGSSAIGASPLLSSPGSPKVDEGAAGDVQPRHLVEEATSRIPETLSEADEPEAVEEEQESVAPAEEKEEPAALPTTPKQTSAFAFSSQPMALDLSPAHTISSFSSSPASSPRKNAHRRQNTNTVSQSSRFPAPTTSLNAARARLNQVLETPASQEKLDLYQTPKSGILKGIPQLSSAAKRGHSVRFSPRPDYRSDSGSWDESGQQSNVGGDAEEEGRKKAVERLLLPAREITIPDVLASASTPMKTASAEDEREATQGQFQQEADAESPAKKAKTEEASQLHTPSRAGNDSVAATSFSQSVRFPGAYAPTPVKSYSRHVIRPSPQNPRMRILPSASSSNPSYPTQGGTAEYGLFPDATLASDVGSSIPRESTPPPSSMRAPDDPRNSPRSPRPVNLGREGFARFDAGSSSDDSGTSSPGLKANTKANESTGTGGDDSLQLTIEKILKTVEESHSAKVKRNALGNRLNAVSQQLAPQSPAVRSAEQRHSPQLELREEDGEKQRIEELRGEVMHALAVLADRLGQLQNTSSAPGDVSSTSITSLSSSREQRRSLPRWATLLLVLCQCALIAYLLSLAEQKAQHMRMFSPSPHQTLYRPSSEVNWNARAQDIHLSPLLSIPGLSNLAASFPPLPSPSFLQLLDVNTGIWEVYRSYVRLNGWTPFIVQLSVYAIAQLLSCAFLLILAPIQVLWLVIDPSRF